jgi:hypothetical protein
MSRRAAILIGVMLIAALGLATLAAARPEPSDRPSDRASFVRHRERAQRRPLVPRPRETREPTESDEDTTTQSGSSQGGGVYVANKTEHHRVSGSGSIGVTSGAVDQGTGGGESRQSFVGQRRTRPRR